MKRTDKTTPGAAKRACPHEPQRYEDVAAIFLARDEGGSRAKPGVLGVSNIAPPECLALQLSGEGEPGGFYYLPNDRTRRELAKGHLVHGILPPAGSFSVGLGAWQEARLSWRKLLEMGPLPYFGMTKIHAGVGRLLLRRLREPDRLQPTEAGGVRHPTRLCYSNLSAFEPRRLDYRIDGAGEWWPLPEDCRFYEVEEQLEVRFEMGRCNELVLRWEVPGPPPGEASEGEEEARLRELLQLVEERSEFT